MTGLWNSTVSVPNSSRLPTSLSFSLCSLSPLVPSVTLVPLWPFSQCSRSLMPPFVTRVVSCAAVPAVALMLPLSPLLGCLCCCRLPVTSSPPEEPLLHLLLYLTRRASIGEGLSASLLQTPEQPLSEPRKKCWTNHSSPCM